MKTIYTIKALFAIALAVLFGPGQDTLSASDSFRFTVTADSQYSPQGFRRILQDINTLLGGHGVFHISCGDNVPNSEMWAAMSDEFGPDSLLYTAVGNHENDQPEYIQWVRDRYAALPYIVNAGPPNGVSTTYSFDYGNVHFVILNQFYDGTIDIHDYKTNGISDPLYNWLVDDLENNTQPIVFVFGHKPAFLVPDDYWVNIPGAPNVRHEEENLLGENIANRDRFWRLLYDKGVAAHFAGHTHFYSARKRNREGENITPERSIGSIPYAYHQSVEAGVWEINVADAQDTRFSSFHEVRIDGDEVEIVTYRKLSNQGNYHEYETMAFFAGPMPVNPPDAAPSQLQAVATSHKAVQLTWTDNSTNERSFRIERREGVAGSFTEVGMVRANRTMFTDTDLSASTDYSYRVRAMNDVGSSAYTNVASATTHALPPVPQAPSNLALLLVTSNRVSLKWDDNATNEEGFILERKTGAAGSYQVVVDLGADLEAFVDTGLGASTTYHYRVKAYNDGGDSGYSNEVSASTLEPSDYYSIDINTSSAGSTTDASGTLSVVGSGSKIWGDADGFRYVYQEDLSGNFSISTKIESNAGSSASGLAGVMLRQELVSLSKYMGIFIQQDGRVRSTSRNPGSSQWAAQDYIDPEGSPTGFPVWLKLSKVGNTITTFSSSDGITWSQRAQRANITFENGFHAGLAVCAWSETQTASAVFSSVSWPGGGAPGAPQNLEATQVTGTSVSLSWSAPSDVENVAGYQVYRNAIPIGTTALTQFADTTVSASTTYNYTVSAHDADGNESAHSAEVEVTTPSSGNNPPVLSPLGSVSIGASQTLQFTVSASDADGDDLSFSATGTSAD